MDITYLGHSSFKLRGKQASLITDPYSSKVGFAFPRVSAEVVTVSHDHFDHNNFSAVGGTSKRENPFVIQHPGEYEVAGISVIGFRAFHDQKEGQERGENTIFVIHVEEITIVHLGDLGHELSEQMMEMMGDIDVLLIPVGGTYTIDSKKAVEIIREVQPSVVIPMHYRTPQHDQQQFGKLQTAQDFLEEGGFGEVTPLEKLTLTKQQLPEEMEVVLLKQ